MILTTEETDMHKRLYLHYRWRKQKEFQVHFWGKLKKRKITTTVASNTFPQDASYCNELGPIQET